MIGSSAQLGMHVLEVLLFPVGVFLQQMSLVVSQMLLLIHWPMMLIMVLGAARLRVVVCLSQAGLSDLKTCFDYGGVCVLHFPCVAIFFSCVYFLILFPKKII